MPIESVYINPFTDYGFKRLFGTEANKDLLIDFLNQFLPDRHQIADLRYARNEQLGANEMDRKAVFDVYCVSHTGDRFIVELQKAQQLYFKDRSIFYASFPIQEQGQTGSWDFRLAAVYTVAVLNFVLAENQDAPDVVSVVQLKDQHGRLFYDKLTFVYLEMPKFRKGIDELETKADKWQYVFNNLSRLQQKPPQMEEPIFQRLFEAAEVANFSKAERERYEQSLKSYRDLQNVLSFTEMKALEAGAQQGYERGVQKGIEEGLQKGIEEGRQKGIEEGLQKGIEEGRHKGIQEGVQQGMQKGVEQGIQQGIQKGIEEGMQQGVESGRKEQARQTALNALAAGLATPLIVSLTGLSEEEIQTLKNTTNSDV